ncbi:MAG: thioredoxin family protein [Candidatus Ancillula sp.]|jgi:thioredoxin 1|nr:thioredoxin family protein [Candidatus Ancillula sp.]
MTILKLSPEQIEETTKLGNAMIVDFWAPWCGPCRAFGPIFEEACKRHPEVMFVKVNIDDFQKFALKEKITSIPTVWAYKDKERVYAEPGALTADELDKLAESLE